jgi:hypothetical protein
LKTRNAASGIFGQGASINWQSTHNKFVFLWHCCYHRGNILAEKNFVLTA